MEINLLVIFNPDTYSLINAVTNTILNGIIFYLGLRYYFIFIKDSLDLHTFWFNLCKIGLISLLSGSFWRLLIDINHISDPNQVTINVVAALLRNFGTGIVIWDLIRRIIKMKKQ